jgi:hypothetical protein
VPLFHLVYISTASQTFTLKELLPLLEESRRRNEAEGVTGILLYRERCFMQLLEGDEAAVLATYARIFKDPRHHGLITLLKGPIQERAFGEWLMGFRDLNLPRICNVPGYSEFMNEDWHGREMRECPQRSLRLLQLFKESFR